MGSCQYDDVVQCFLVHHQMWNMKNLLLPHALLSNATIHKQPHHCIFVHDDRHSIHLECKICQQQCRPLNIFNQMSITYQRNSHRPNRRVQIHPRSVCQVQMALGVGLWDQVIVRLHLVSLVSVISLTKSKLTVQSPNWESVQNSRISKFKMYSDQNKLSAIAES